MRGCAPTTVHRLLVVGACQPPGPQVCHRLALEGHRLLCVDSDHRQLEELDYALAQSELHAYVALPPAALRAPTTSTLRELRGNWGELNGIVLVRSVCDGEVSAAQQAAWTWLGGWHRHPGPKQDSALRIGMLILRDVLPSQIPVLRSATEQLARRCRADRIRVNTLACPELAASALAQRGPPIRARTPPQQTETPERERVIADAIPDAVLALLSPLGSVLTGATLSLDGGAFLDHLPSD